MSIELGRRLLASELVTREHVRDALLLTELLGISLPRAIIERGIVTEAELDEEIARHTGPGLRYVQGSAELVAKLPRAMPRRLSALPTRIDPATGVVDVAAADPFDPHVESEMSFHLDAPVRVMRASIGAVEEAIRRIERAMENAPAEASVRSRRLTPALPYGAPGSIPPPAPSTPIPLVVKRSVDHPSLDDADTYVDDLHPNELDELDRIGQADTAALGKTAAWGAPPPVRPEPQDDADEPATLGKTAAWGAPPPVRPEPQDDADEPATLGKTAAWGAPPAVRPEPQDDADEPATLGKTAAWGAPPPVRPEPHDDADEPATLGKTAAWGAPPPVRLATPKNVRADEPDTLGRTAAWGSARQPGVATVAPAQPLNRTLGFEEDAPRVSFPSTPPPGHDSIPPPLGFAPPEVSAWKGLTNAPVPRDASSSPEITTEEVDVENTFVSEPGDLPPGFSPPSLPVETISLNSIPDPPPARASSPSDPNIDHFDDVPDRPTLIDFPPPAAPVDVRALIADMANVTTRDGIVELTFRCMSNFANRVALFSAKRDGFHGWLCNEAFGSSDALRKVFIPNDQPSVMATAAATSIYLGPIPQTPVHDSLRAVMGRATGDVAVASVRVGSKVAAMLVCDELRDTLSGTRRMDELARAMGDALTRLVKTRG